ncbi:MAG: ABC transporter ATP-binding protein [Geminicoccaceae bacterium]
MNPLIAVRDLHVSFAADEGTVEAVRGVSFDIAANRTTAIVGESGSGKTVVSHAILGILPKSAHIGGGSILFDDPLLPGGPRDLATMDPNSRERRQIRGGRIAIIFQEPMSSLSPLHTIGDQIGEAYRLHVEDNQEAARSATIEILEKVGFPRADRAFSTYTFELSGGLRQRAMIAMALICRPALLIADEPTTALDVTIQAQILKLIEDLKAELGMAILFITHDLGVVANIADDVVVMYRGRVMEKGPSRELIRSPRHPYLQALLHAVPTIGMDPNVRLQSISDVEADGRGSKVQHAPHLPTNDWLLRVEGLRKTFVGRRTGLLGTERRIVRAVDDVSFTVHRQECLALVGESGCGKTTVSKLIMRGLTPDEGRILFHDGTAEVDVLALDDDALLQLRTKIQYMFQDPFGSLNPRMTVEEIVAEPLLIHGIGDAASRAARVATLLDAVGLNKRHSRRYPHSFSGGQRQRIGIARALALEPSLLLCDEPVSALDVSVQAQILNLLKDLQAELGLTYLFVSHNLAVVRYLAHRVAVMCAGRIVELADTDSLFDDPQHPYTRALLAAVPEPDLDHPLDFAALLAGRASEPAAWPEPYRLDGHSGTLIACGQGHFVRVSE